ncbi:MAG: hypothetical protein HY272_11230 [Gammaproteobacteria bacterium]|nr:hypothetical protein [Gammaproteobacteria bacterium]
MNSTHTFRWSLLLCAFLLPPRVFSAADIPVTPETPPPPGESLAELPEDPLAATMEQARRAFSSGDYSRAAQLYTKALDSKDKRFAQVALEMLGVVRERNGQYAQAKAVYEQYLSRFPKGEGAVRVRQRLAGLVTAEWKPKETVPETKPVAKQEKGSEFYGSFGQTYRHFSTSTATSSSDQSSLLSSIDLNARGHSSNLDIKGRINAGHLADITSNKDKDYLYFAYLDLSGQSPFGARIGRQTQYDSGIFGRFDGLNLRMRLPGGNSVKLAGGSPVESSSHTRVDPLRHFVSLSLDTQTSDRLWNFNGYLINQTAESLNDRRAIGLESRYYSETQTFAGLVDYDVGYHALNILMAQGTLTLADQNIVNYAIDYRSSPLLATRNAIIGQPVTKLDELRQLFTESEIRDLAADRTATSRIVMLGISHPFSSRWRGDLDYSASDLSATPASGGVAATDSTGIEHSISGRLVGNGIGWPQDYTTFALRLATAQNIDQTTFNANHRHVTTDGWRINPGMRLNYRRYNDRADTQWDAAPNLKVDYLWGKRFYFELEAGYERSHLNTWPQAIDTDTTYLYAGYRVNF